MGFISISKTVNLNKDDNILNKELFFQEPMLNAVKRLRQEKDKQRELQAQKSEQRIAISHAEQRIGRLEQQVKLCSYPQLFIKLQ